MEAQNIKKSKKYLFVFDLDLTILSENSDYVFLDLLTQDSRDELKPLYETRTNWAQYMQEVFIRLKRDNIVLDQVRQRVENIKLNPGFKEIFEFLKAHNDKFDTLIISNANTLFIKWVLEKNKLIDLFPLVYSNWAEPDEDKLIKISGHHSHDCRSCDKAQCKRLIFNEHLNSLITEREKTNSENQHYEVMMFAGDGHNDFCAGRVLRQNDIFFPREGYPLHDAILKEENQNILNCNIQLWNDGFKILEEIKKLVV
jgi:2,3-diketo-5-methylthio-1-phosphopentane phosphatase